MSRPTFRRRHGLVRVVGALAFAIGLAAAPSGSTSAGGWAVGSLDAIPSAVVGQSERIGFTILQHGIRPADVEGSVGIELVGTDGTRDFFPAVSDGEVGRYSAVVDFPEVAGSYAWSLRMGWFPSQDLGVLNVVATAPAGAGAAWSSARLALGGLTLALASVAFGDRLLSRRRERVGLV